MFPYPSRVDTENNELARSVTNKWNRQYGDKKTLLEDTMWAWIYRISVDNFRNAATKARRRMAQVWLRFGKIVIFGWSLTCFYGREMENEPPFDNKDVFPAPSVRKKPITSSANHTPLLTPSAANAELTIAAAVATPTTATPVAAPPSDPTSPRNNCSPFCPSVLLCRLSLPRPSLLPHSSLLLRPSPLHRPSLLLRWLSLLQPLEIQLQELPLRGDRAHSFGQLLGMIQGYLPFAENDILMISTDRATISWTALNLEVWVRVRDDNDAAKVYFNVTGSEEWLSGTDDNAITLYTLVLVYKTWCWILIVTSSDHDVSSVIQKVTTNDTTNATTSGQNATEYLYEAQKEKPSNSRNATVTI
ncbi:hypothetical protein BDD12DRAFT_810359 [Trichophaea hybrida]|nr:hypothetical protein BDD12DRAFT_810359 [Trichophaea hybrida]